MIMYKFNHWNFGERVAAKVCDKLKLRREDMHHLHIDEIYYRASFLYVFARMFPRATKRDIDLKDFELGNVRSCFELCDLCDMLILPRSDHNG